MTYKIITPDLQENLYQIDSKDVFYSIGENYIGIVTPEKKFLINYDVKPKFIAGGKGQDDMLIITANHNLKEKELSVLEKYQVKTQD